MRKLPKLCRHKAKKLAYVTINQKPVYLGPWPDESKPAPAEARRRYEEEVGKLLQGRASRPAPVPDAPTVDEIWLAYKHFTEGYYLKNGRHTSEVCVIRTACRVAAQLHGEVLAADFTPRMLKEVRQAFLDKGWSRRNINKQVGRVVGMFRWAAVEEERIPVSVVAALERLKGLRKGRTTAPERVRKKKVAWASVEAALPHLAEPVNAMVRVHYLLGCRAEEVCCMRPKDLDRTGDVWLYFPDVRKLEHQEEGEDDDELARQVYWVGAQAQAILLPLLGGCKKPKSYVFPTHGKPGVGASSLGCYTTASYRRAVARVIEKHKLPHWSPRQLRHARLTEVRRLYHIEGAQAIGGHKNISTTELYAERSLQLARKIMGEIG